MSRAVFVSSSRGGVGKSTFVRLLAEMHRQRETGAVLVDADQGVGQLIKHLGERDANTGRLLAAQSVERGVQTMDWHADVRGRDAIASYLEHRKVAIFDMPGGSLATFRALDAETRFFAEIVPAMGYASTIVVLVTPYKETWADASLVAEGIPNADVLLVRNGGFGDARDFAKWDQSDTRATLLKGGAREMEFPGLAPGIAADVAFYRLRFLDAPHSEHVAIMDRGRARTWLEAATNVVLEASDVLGLDVTAKPNAKRGAA